MVHSNPIYEQMAQLTFLWSVEPFYQLKAPEDYPPELRHLYHSAFLGARLRVAFLVNAKLDAVLSQLTIEEF